MTANLKTFSEFLQTNGKLINVQKVLELKNLRENAAEIVMISQGMDMWDSEHDNLLLGRYRRKFLQERNALGINAQCTEHRVKESAMVLLGNRKSTCSICALARDDTKKTGQDCIEDEIQIQNKDKTRQPIMGADLQELQLKQLREKIGKRTYQEVCNQVRSSLKDKDKLFKKERIEKWFTGTRATSTSPMSSTQ